MNWFKKKPREDWRLVATKEAVVQWTDIKKDEVIYYYLYESNLGRRRFEIKETGYCKDYCKGSEMKYYLKYVYPWSRGENFNDIPSYWDKINGENTKHVDRLYKLILTPNNPNVSFKK